MSAQNFIFVLKFPPNWDFLSPEFCILKQNSGEEEIFRQQGQLFSSPCHDAICVAVMSAGCVLWCSCMPGPASAYSLPVPAAANAACLQNSPPSYSSYSCMLSGTSQDTSV